MNKEKLFLSTIAADAPITARTFGLGLEIAEYCTAWNMDDEFEQTDAAVRKKLAGIENRVLHAPFNELFPCAIDRNARELAAYRYRQAIDLTKQYDATKVIIHGGYNGWLYYPVWYVEQSITFWKEFMKEDPGVQIVLENVLETDPQWLLDIIRGVGDPRLKMCLDIGHVSAYSHVSVTDWLETCAPWISHFHIHNNDGTQDQHNALNEGRIPMNEFFHQAVQLCPDATFTLELIEAAPSVTWLLDNKMI